MEEHDLEILDAECVEQASREVEMAVKALAFFYGLELCHRSGVKATREAYERAGRFLAGRKLRRLAEGLERESFSPAGQRESL